MIYQKPNNLTREIRVLHSIQIEANTDSQNTHMLHLFLLIQNKNFSP